MKPIEKIVKDTKKVIKKNIILVGKELMNDLSSYPPNVKNLLDQYGNQIIKSLTLKRTPVDKVLTGSLSLFSLGKFGQRLKRNFDELFHLFIEITTENGTRLLLEKNERLNMELNPKERPGTEIKNILNIPSGLTINQLIENTRKKMGSQFFNYDAVKNNCQDFLLNVLQANNIGDQSDYDFIKQDTEQLFKNLPILKKVAHATTNLGAIANVVMQGGDLTKSQNIKNYGMILEHLVSHIKDPSEPIDPKDYKQAIKLVNVIKQLKKGGIKGNGMKKSSEVQSIIFPKENWTISKSKKWLKLHNYKYGKVDKTPSTLRFRQQEPSQFKNFRIKTLPNGVMLVLAFK